MSNKYKDKMNKCITLFDALTDDEKIIVMDSYNSSKGENDHVHCYEPDILICPHCNAEQVEHPQNYIMDDISYVDCDECEKNFYFEEVYYISCFKEGPLEALENIAKQKEDDINKSNRV